MRPEKKSISSELQSKVRDSAFVILADYRGLSVSKTDDLRKRLRGVKASLQVIQNRVFGHTIRELEAKGLAAALKGPSAMVYGKGDVVQAAKVLKDFVRENERPVVKLGTMGSVVLTPADIETLAGLPGREVLLSMLVGTIAAPMQQLVGVLQQKLASLVYVLKAVQEKKEQA